MNKKLVLVSNIVRVSENFLSSQELLEASEKLVIMSFDFPRVILKLFSISANGGAVGRYWNLNTSAMVVITVVVFLPVTQWCL